MSNTCYLKNGSTYRVSSKMALDLHDHLPAGNFLIKQDPRGELYLDQIDSFTTPPKLYGNVSTHTRRILHSFAERPISTGVMLAGEKGSGKTLLAKNICRVGAEQGMPSIIINAPWRGDQFNSLIQMIEQPCIVLFDEFEKVYDKAHQPAILTLLDGVFPSKKLFILTCNDKWQVDVHMRNRPGRIFYMLNFNGLSMEFIEEYCRDTLINKDYIDRVCKISTVFDSFNFDMLKALVEEMNRFNETPQEALSMLNVKPEFGLATEFNVSLIVNNKEIAKEKLDDQTVRVNPLFNPFALGFYHEVSPETKEGDRDSDDAYEQVLVTPNEIERIDAKEGRYVFRKDNKVITLSKVKHTYYNYLESF